VLSSKSLTVVLHVMLIFFINICNSLPSHIVHAPSVAIFRKRLRFQFFQVQLFLNCIIVLLYFLCFLFGHLLVQTSSALVSFGVVLLVYKCHTVSYVGLYVN